MINNSGKNNPMFGKHHTEETKEKMRKSSIERFSNKKNHPWFGKKHSKSSLEKMSKTKIEMYYNGYINPKLGKISSEETKQKISENHADVSGEKNPNWQGGIMFIPYCQKFNGKLKEQIRKRDSGICQLCGKTELENGRKLAIHHVHYDKENCDPDLVCLCNKCHCKVNFNRDYYEELFMNKLKERGMCIF